MLHKQGNLLLPKNPHPCNPNQTFCLIHLQTFKEITFPPTPGVWVSPLASRPVFNGKAVSPICLQKKLPEDVSQALSVCFSDKTLNFWGVQAPSTKPVGDETMTADRKTFRN